MKISPAMKAVVRKPGAVLAMILVLGLLIRLWEMANITAIELDGSLYANMGELWSKGAFREALGGLFSPFFPLLIGIFHFYIPDLEFAGRMVSMVSGMLLIYVSFLFMRRFWGERVALYGAFLVAFHPYLSRNSTLVLSESVATLLFASAVFLFYRGLKEDRTGDICFSGLLLGLTYLTRPEFIIYFAPLSILLLIKKRYVHTVLFLICFSLLVGAYLYYLKADTGLLVISKKAILAKNHPVVGAKVQSYLLPVLPIKTIVRITPSVILHFFEALFVPVCLLLFLGFRKIERPYRLLVILVVTFHVLTIATMTASSRRLSMEFIPLVIPFAVEGLFVIERFWAKFRAKRLLWYSTIGIVLVACLSQAFTSPDGGRALHKRAGLYLLSFDPGHPVMSRLPLIAFYSKGEWVHILPLMQKDGSCGKLPAIAAKGKARYFAVDDVMEKELPFLKHCVYGLPLVVELRDGDDFIKLYRLDNG
jgi:hypothetical protein